MRSLSVLINVFRDENTHLSGFWVNNVDNLYDYLAEMLKYKISSVVQGIKCLTLLTCAEGDPLAEGSSVHCEGMARSLYHQRVFDWLDEILGK